MLTVDMNDPVVSAIVSARVSLVFNQPFLGNLAPRMNIIQADGWCKTAATDGRNFYYNREFIKSLTQDQLIFLIGHEVMHCFPAGTIIPGTFKPIEELEKNDLVIGEHGNASYVVEPMSRYYDGDVVTIKARGMLPLVATDEHPILVSRPTWKTIKSPVTGKNKNVREWSTPEWKTSQNISVGDWVQVPRIKGIVTDCVLNFEQTKHSWDMPDEIKNGVLLTTEVAELIGWYVAEGSTTTTQSGYLVSTFTINANERDVAMRLQDILWNSFGIQSRIDDHDGENSNVCRLHFQSSPLAKWLKMYCGEDSHTKRIPYDVLYNQDLEILTAFLTSYVQGDGNIGRGVNYNTVSQTLALQLQLAFARYGILFNLHQRAPSTSIIRGKVVNSGPSYHGHTAWKEAFTLLNEISNASRSTCYGGVVDDAIYTPITSATKSHYSGKVYNIETSCHTYTAGNIVTHNCVYDHLGRKGSRDHKIWNMAIDYIVNSTLVQSKIGVMPKGGLISDKYTDEMTSEEVYRLLEQNSVKIQVPLDEHLDLEGGTDGDGNKQVSVTVMGDGNGPPSITEEDRQKIRNELRAAVINAAQAAGAGKTPAGVKRLIDMFTNPILDWQTMLELFIQSQVKDDFTFSRPSRRSWVGDQIIILPGQNFKKRIELTAVIDLSGSMTDEMIKDFLSETKGIMDTFDDFELILFTFDTKVYNPKRFTPDNADEILEYEPQGGGGTMFECIWEFLKEPESQGFGDEFPEPIEPPKLVIFTDGYPNNQWGDENYCETLFIIHSNNHIIAPFGITVYYGNDASGA